MSSSLGVDLMRKLVQQPSFRTKQEAFEAGLQLGIQQERERIMSLLKDNHYRGDWNSPCANWAILLIETNNEQD
jgi:hypothetical protein